MYWMSLLQRGSQEASVWWHAQKPSALSNTLKCIILFIVIILDSALSFYCRYTICIWKLIVSRKGLTANRMLKECFKAHIWEKISFSISRVWKRKNAEFPTWAVKVSFILSDARPATPKPQLTEPPPQCKLMAKQGASNITNWGKFSTSLPRVCAGYLYLDDDTDMEKLKMKIQPFCTQKNKVISSSPFTLLINSRLSP